MEMKISFFTSILCIIVGIALIAGAVVAYPLINTPLNNLQTKTNNILTEATTALSSAQQAINSTQVTLVYLSSTANATIPTLSNSSLLTGNIANNLTSVASTISGVGQTLSTLNIAGSSPLASVGSSVSSISQPLQNAASYLQNISSSLSTAEQDTSNVPSTLNTITLQMSRLNDSITGLLSNVQDTQNSLPTYFNLARLVVILGLLALGGLGAIFLLIGLSLFTLRRRSIHLSWRLSAVSAVPHKTTV
jgi:hypothetical protein